MPGLVPGIHVFEAQEGEDVDGRDKPGHDGKRGRKSDQDIYELWGQTVA
jgi:hypothetical protein